MTGRMPQLDEQTISPSQRRNWHVWQWRSPATRERLDSRERSTGAQSNLLTRLFRWGRPVPTDTEAPDSLLHLARDWLLATGGKVAHSGGDHLEGVRADGTSVRWTVSPQMAWQEPDLALLTFGTPAFEMLAADIARHGSGLALRIDEPSASATALARAAFALPSGTCKRCSDASGRLDRTDLCPDCPLRTGHFVVAGAGALRAAVVEETSERRSLEYAFWIGFRSAGELRAELMRVAIDSATGERLAPLDEAALGTARAIDRDPQLDTVAAEAGAEATVQLDPSRRLDDAVGYLQPAINAAARLARARALPAYQSRQEDVVTTFDQLLRESPDMGRRALAARDQALARLAETDAVEAETRLVAAVPVMTPTARVLLRFASGADVRVTVDVARRKVDRPLCTVCGTPWRVAATCDDGHLTCLNCQRMCEHCGARRCERCTFAPYTACAACGAASCAQCTKATARGRHRIRIAPPREGGASDQVTLLPRGEQSHPSYENPMEAEPNEQDSEDLRVAHCDAMTPTTWREFLRWYCQEHGFGNVRIRSSSDRETVLLCQMASDDLILDGRSYGASPAASSWTLVIGLRPRQDTVQGLAARDLDRVYAIAQETKHAAAILVTTANVGARAAALTSRGIAIIDRAQLEQWLVAAQSVHQQQRQDAERAMDAHAASAAQVQTLLIAHLESVVEALAIVRLGNADMVDGSMEGTFTVIERRVNTARQALAALETLVEEWERALGQSFARARVHAIADSDRAFVEQHGRAVHLLAVLGEAASGLAGTAGDSTADERWLGAIRDELREGCLALIARSRATDPTTVRGLRAEHHQDATRASIEHAAASKRAALRAHQMRDRMASKKRTREQSQSRAV